MEQDQEVFQLYPLQPKQLEFANTFAKYRLYGGAKGGGKSYAMRAECVRQCLSLPGVRWLVLRRTFPEIRENMIVPMQSELPSPKTWFYKYNVSDSVFTFHNGSTLRFSYCQNMQDVMNYQWIEYDFICIEELTHWNEEERRTLMSSLRTSKKWIIPNFFGSTNPWWRGHGRVKRLFVDRQFKEKEKPEQYAFISAKVWDNFALMQSQPEYLEDLEALPETKRRAYLEGDWNVFEWQFFKEFREEIHVIDPIVPKDVKRRIVCLDYWYTNPSAVYWLAKDNQDDVTCYRELYITWKTYKQLAIQILAMTPESEKIEVVIVDPAIVNKKSSTTWSAGGDEMKSVWLKIRGWKNSRISWRSIVRDFLQPYEDPNTKRITSSLKITSNCVNLIRTLPQLVHDKTNVEDIDTKLEDHAADSIRYWLVELWVKKKSLSQIRTVNDSFKKQASEWLKRAEESRKPPSKRKRTSDARSILNHQF